MKFEEIAKSFSVKNLPESEVELTGEVPFAVVAPYREMALVHIAEHLEMPGFRPGKVPASMALQKVGEISVLEEAVELFVKDFYPELVEVLKIDAVGRPEIRVTKLAPDNPVGLVIETSIYPTVDVPPQWKSLHEKVAPEAPLPATEEEVTQTLENLRQSRKQKSPLEGTEDIVPELNDDFAKSVGAFENLSELKEQITKGITEEKVRAARDARRGKLIEKLLEETPLAVPKIFIESELEKMLSQMREDVQKFGMSWEQYLERVSKTEEGVRNEFREQATKRAKLQLILNKIAEDEKIEVDPKAVEDEMKHALEHFPDAKPGLVRIHIETVMRNEIVLKMLEGEAKKE
jgi:FKBP-type peptidyl-prolyl cis-trans isomerase (trigger factor)